MEKFQKILLAISVIAIVVLFGLLIVVKDISSDAVSAFLGVLIGGVITGYIQYLIAGADRRHELRTAALDKRLQSHQEAYTLWRKLLFANKKNDDVYDVIMECQEWWDNNCLYLTASARRAFQKAYMSAGEHASFLAIHAESKLVKAAFEDVERAGPIIVEGVYLPAIGEMETERADSKNKEGND